MNTICNSKLILKKIISYYPNRANRLTFFDFIKLVMMDFGLLFIAEFIYLLFNLKIHWSTPVVRNMDLLVYAAVMVGSFIHMSFVELLIIALTRFSLRRKKRREEKTGRL